MSERTLLVVDDDRGIRDALADTLHDSGFATFSAADGPEAMRILQSTDVDMVISDMQMVPFDGAELLSRMRSAKYSIPMILMTAYATVEQAVASMRDGAAHYLAKPFEMPQLIRLIDQLCPTALAPDALVAEDPATRELVRTAALVALSDATVTISGESGTGKEVIARLIHERSPRSAKPFVAINCAAIPDNMLEALLFGHVKGAYTGATRDNPGKFELAQTGTILLDEISEMDLGLQAKLLRVLQEKEVERIGASAPVALDVRVLATTNRDLREEVGAGRFREDLFYRLNVFPLTVPPLRERPRDIVPLARFMLARFGEHLQTAPTLSDEAAVRLCAYNWPGNVRELENLVQRSLILCQGGDVGTSHLHFETESDFHTACPNVSSAEAADAGLQDALLGTEQQLILDTLRETTGNRTAAAERLGISPRTLRYKMARLKRAGIPIPAPHSGAVA